MECLGVDVPLWVVLVLVAALLVWVYVYKMSQHQWVFTKLGIPGPKPALLFGNLKQMVTKGLGDFDLEGIQKYGKVFGSSDMFNPLLIVADKDMLREILVKNFSNFPERRVFEPNSLSGDMQYGLGSVKGENWHRARNTISPTFSSGKLRKMIPLINEVCATLVNTTQKCLKEGDGQVELRRLFGGYTMDAIGSTAFGIHLDSQSNPDDKFVKHGSKMFDFDKPNPWLLLLMFFPALKHLWVKLGASIFPKDSMAYFRALVEQLMEDRKRSKEERHDFLQLMMNAEVQEDDSSSKQQRNTPKNGLTFDEIVANAEIFFSAGYETTAITLTMTSYNLATNPDCQDKLRQEIEEKIGSGELTYENVLSLQYLDMCVSETLRMYPPGQRLERTCTQTTVIKGITIPAGMVVVTPVYAIHHHPDIWENPEAFRPDRFSPAEKAQHDPLDYLPFGYGPRVCIGMRLAQLELKMALAHVIRKFRFSVGSKTDVPPKLLKNVILKPVHMWLKMEEIDA